MSTPVNPFELLEDLRDTRMCESCGKQMEFANGKWVHSGTGDALCFDEDCKEFDRRWAEEHRVQ
jgi:hypothetical protein